MRIIVSKDEMVSILIAEIGHHLRLLAFAIGISCTMALPVLAQDNDTLLEFFAGQGCAIGPTTKATAIAAGFKPQEIDLLSKTARKDTDTVLTGGWLVLPPAVCEIRVPEVNSKIHVSDSEVAENISAIDAYAAEGEPGCFLNGGALLERVQKTRNWDENMATIEYIRFLSASLVSGDLAFYWDSPLRTPVGFILTTGECANIPLMPEIRRNHALMIKHFGPFIRANAANVECEYGDVMSVGSAELINNLSGGETTNEWQSFEYQMIAMGAGWYEGGTMTKKGTPRPPLCHYVK